MMFSVLTSLDRSEKRAILLAIDLVAATLALVLTWALVAGRLPDPDEALRLSGLLAVLLAVVLIATLALGLHRVKVNTYELKGVLENSAVAIALALVGAAVNPVFGRVLPEQSFVILGMSSAILSVGSRMALRSYVLWLYAANRSRKRVLLYGAGQTGQQLATALSTDDSLVAVGFVDDNPALHGLTVAGLKVVSPVHLQREVADKRIDRVVIAMPSARASERAAIQRRLRGIGCEVISIPSFADMVVEGILPRGRDKIDVQALIGRAEIAPSLPALNGTYREKRVLVTGAGGSIGKELCRQVQASGPECLVALDHSEYALYSIERELSESWPEQRMIAALGSVCDPDFMARVMRDHQIDIVLHAAAYKHVPMVENNLLAGLNNNVLGTKVAAEAAARANVERFILISSDKAVRPTSAMGASKRMAELVVQDLTARNGSTRFSMVRFGNVLGSSGSVIPLFEEQIARGGPVTLTDRNVTRFFMTVSEAVRLVLLAGTFARGGEVFVLNMGKPVRIENLARAMIQSAGYSVRDAANPDGDIEIEIIGLRGGEKLHEELLIGSDMLTTPHPKILRAQEDSLSSDEMADLIADLTDAVETGDEHLARRVMSRWVEPQRSAQVIPLEAANG